MFKKKKILAIIPARAGSKGLKNKNIKKIFNKPLYLHSVEFAINCKFIDKVCVTTNIKKIIDKLSGNKKILLIERNYKLSNDRAKSVDVIFDALKKIDYFNYDYFILLEPTSPLRSLNDIKKSLNKIILTDSDNIVSLSENICCSPEFLYSMTVKKKIKNYLTKNNSHVRRQDVRNKTYFLNGTFYISNIKRFLKSKNLFKNALGYITHKKYSFEIDDKFDFKILKYLMK
jgi:CMP-N-acetylneuraminic acid synthetase